MNWAILIPGQTEWNLFTSILAGRFTLLSWGGEQTSVLSRRPSCAPSCFSKCWEMRATFLVKYYLESRKTQPCSPSIALSSSLCSSLDSGSCWLGSLATQTQVELGRIIHMIPYCCAGERVCVHTCRLHTQRARCLRVVGGGVQMASCSWWAWIKGNVVGQNSTEARRPESNDFHI